MNERIKEVRKALGLTLERFGERLGVGKSVLSQIENGKSAVTDQMFKSICREFNVNPEWLRNGTGDMYAPQTKNQEILAFANKVMSDEDEAFRKRLIHALSESTPEFWEEFERIVNQLMKKD